MPMNAASKQSLAWVGIALVLGLLLWLLAPVLTPFIVASVLAYALTPLVDRLHRLFKGHVPRALSVAVVEMIFFVLLLALLLLVVPIVVKELPQIRNGLPALADKLNQALQPLLTSLGVQFTLDSDGIRDFAMKYFSGSGDQDLSSMLAPLLQSVKVGGSVALAIVGNAVLIPVVLFYLLMDWRRFVDMTVALVPKRLRPAFDSFNADADAVLGQYLRGQLLVMLLLAIYYSIALRLFGLDLAMPIGVFTGMAVFIPYLGFGTGLVLAFLAGLLQFSLSKALLMVAVVYGVGQFIEGFFLTPRLVGERIGLHPVAVIFALMAFGQLFGFVGVMVALPASAVVLVAIRRIRSSYLASRLYTG